MKKTIFIKAAAGLILIAGTIFFGNFLFWKKDKDVQDVQIVEDVENVQDIESIENVQDVKSVENVENVQDTLMEVPFVLQAPLGNWDDRLFQDACEEAAILMVDGWLDGKTVFTKEQMKKGIEEIAKLETQILGGYIDTSTEDTAQIMKTYTDWEKINIYEDIKLEKIKQELVVGNLVIVPTDGRKLGNHFYTAPGPVTHMIVITGYDVDKKEFIVNDSGTKKGENFRYGEDVLFAAIRDYPTGSHYINPIKEGFDKKVMIVVMR